MRFVRACLFLLAALAPVAGYAQTVPAGTVTLLNGEAQALGAGGASHSLAKGDGVFEGDTIQTGAASYLLVRFTDQGSVLLRPNSRFQVERYQYSGAAATAAAAPAAAPVPVRTVSGAESSFFRLLKGGLRAVSGLIAHANYDNYRMSTPVATMGIRGTDYELVMCDGPCQSDPTVLQSVPQGADLNGAVVAGVNDGQVVMTSFTGNSLQLGAGQYAITLANGSQYLLGGVPGFLSLQSAAAGAGGVAAGGSTAASSVAAGTVVVTGVAAVGVAAIVGVVVAGSGSNGSGTSTSTSTTTTTATTPAH